MKMYCVISNESIKRFKGIRGKMMAQAGHAFLHAYWNSEEFWPSFAQDYKDSDHARKITVVVETDAEMIELYNKYIKVCGVTKVIDAGFTVFEEPTLTCVGIGPIPEIFIQDDLKQLKLLS